MEDSFQHKLDHEYGRFLKQHKLDQEYGRFLLT